MTVGMVLGWCLGADWNGCLGGGLRHFGVGFGGCAGQLGLVGGVWDGCGC